MAVRLLALRAGRPLSPGRFLVLICGRDWVDARATVRVEGLWIEKKSNDLTGNRNRDLPTCSIVPQPTTVPRALEFSDTMMISKWWIWNIWKKEVVILSHPDVDGRIKLNLIIKNLGEMVSTAISRLRITASGVLSQIHWCSIRLITKGRRKILASLATNCLWRSAEHHGNSLFNQ
jgi:hypothetical protein